MFTGLVQAVGVVRSVEVSAGGLRVVVDPAGWAHVPAQGDSICVSGCCLTVAGVDGGAWAFDVVPETLGKTTIGGLAVGTRVNLEHSVTAATLLGGHFVQGHVDGVAVVERVERGGEAGWRVWLRVGPELMKYMTSTGSVCLDGVSLTLASVAREAGAGGLICVALIPTTLERTTLSAWRKGDKVNVEADVIAKTVVGYMEVAEWQSDTVAE
ncbi:MAG: riboflavin synthase [Phycisphaerales bacterium]